MSDVTPAVSGDADFERQVEPFRRELHAHCYRMLGSVHDADDALQDAMVRAWRRLATFEGRGSLRSWLYSIATNACLDLISTRGKRALPVDLGPASERAVVDSAPLTDVAWLEPYPDARYEVREAVELAFVAALQHLPGNQRAALLLFDVLGYSVAEIAELMATSTTSVNSALARARRIVAEKMPDRADQPAAHKVDDAKLRAVSGAFAAAFERHDTAALVELLTEDVTWEMPPLPHWYAGRTSVAEFAGAVPMKLCPSWRHRTISANGQPAVALYVGEHADAEHTAWSINLLTPAPHTAGDGWGVARIVSFLDPELFEVFGLPRVR
ncbi:sigma-70 family RNA polymerase sigma factor [Flindersiella endophytica]